MKEMSFLPQTGYWTLQMKFLGTYMDADSYPNEAKTQALPFLTQLLMRSRYVYNRRVVASAHVFCHWGMSSLCHLHN